uniref:WHIM1 domain-containing protein n=1 Tax=Caenorhabditis tropicalis TaxID=1561998 RepID=A0A1I7TLW1_9PELO
MSAPTTSTSWQAPEPILTDLQRQMNSGIPLNADQTRILLTSLCSDPRPVNVPEKVLLKSTDLNDLLLIASANGYHSQYTGMYTYNWQNPNGSDFAQMRNKKRFWKSEYMKLDLEFRTLKTRSGDEKTELSLEINRLKDALAMKETELEDIKDKKKTRKLAKEARKASDSAQSCSKIVK